DSTSRYMKHHPLSEYSIFDVNRAFYQLFSFSTKFLQSWVLPTIYRKMRFLLFSGFGAIWLFLHFQP
ncbi:MAG: hypothetical protein MJ065_05165, partial [Oscillospiraceae bacterium]|nr:hypothetical protein [Oscillospiraceae bacterium]